MPKRTDLVNSLCFVCGVLFLILWCSVTNEHEFEDAYLFFNWLQPAEVRVAHCAGPV